jgi:DNA polymerase III epsilon subunit family exonuclease
MQLRLDAADRLVELVEERHGLVPAEEAATALFALARPPHGLARGLLDEVVSSDARLAWRGGAVGLVRSTLDELPLEAATYVVFDLETTGLSPSKDGICEIGAVRVVDLGLAGTFETLVDPARPLPAGIAALTGIRERDLRGQPHAPEAVRRFLDFAGECVLVAHNARFDVGFVDKALERMEGRRLATPVLDTVWLARRLLAGRTTRVSLSSLACFFGTSVDPCHRALPDAQATAEALIALLGLSQERGARTVGDVLELAAPRARRVYGKRSLAFGAPTRPGVYLFRDRARQVLYVGRARDLRARLRSYFRSERQRPAVEAALLALERVEWRVLGSELEAALEEARLIRELRPPANARALRPDRCVYLRRRGDGIVVSSKPGELGPIRSRRRAELAARALGGATERELALLSSGGPLPRLRTKLTDLAECLRYEDAARLRDRIRALEAVIADLARLDRLRETGCCLLVPALEDGFTKAYFVAGGRIAASRTVPPGAGAALEIRAGLAAAREAQASPVFLDPVSADELELVDGFIRRPPPELAVAPLDERTILATLEASVTLAGTG